MKAILLLSIQLLVIFNCVEVTFAIKTNPFAKSWFQFPSSSTDSSPSSQTKKDSIFRIDPSTLVRKICKYSGVILPESIERDLKIFARTCKCDEIGLDLINRELEVSNFTVSSPSEKRKNEPALRVGRICVRWDSYIKPCLEIEVDDVDVIIEFLNLFLTRNNWNELKDEGFPPSFYSETKDVKSKSFLTIGSIDLSGKFVIRIHSRTLGKQLINDIEFDLNNLDDLNEKIKNEAQQVVKINGRRGCTTDELYDVIRVYFNNLLQNALKRVAADLTFGTINGDTELGLPSLNEAKKVLSNSKETLLKYVKSVGEKTNDDIERNLSDLGLRPEHIGTAKDLSNRFASNLLRTNLDNI